MTDLSRPAPDIVALHGFTGGAASWTSVEANLPTGLRLWAPDLPGHAGWDDALPTSFEATVDRLALSIRDRTESVHLVGYSLGARLALGLAVEHPDLVRSATLIGVRPGLASPKREERALDDERLADELLRDGLETFVDHWQSLPLFASQNRLDPEWQAEQRRLRLSHQASGLAWALRVLSPGRMPDYRLRLGEIRCPVTLMVGDLDTKFLEIARDFESLFQEIHSSHANHEPVRGSDDGVQVTCSVRTVPGAGHNLPLEAPDAVAEAVTHTVAAVGASRVELKQPA